MVRWSRSSLDTVAHSWLRWFGILGREILSTTNCTTKNSCDFEKLVLYLSRMIASHAAEEENSYTSPYALRHAIKVPNQSYQLSSNIRDIHPYSIYTKNNPFHINFYISTSHCHPF